MTDERCKCSMSISVLGDGCRYCQPQECIDRLIEQIEEAEGVLEELSLERQHQDGKWGGPAHDDQRGPFDWVRNIRNYVGWAEQMADMDSPDKYRRRMIQIAALAVAAVESHDRLMFTTHKNEDQDQ